MCTKAIDELSNHAPVHRTVQNCSIYFQGVCSTHEQGTPVMRLELPSSAKSTAVRPSMAAISPSPASNVSERPGAATTTTCSQPGAGKHLRDGAVGPFE